MRIAFGTDETTALTEGIVGGLVDAGHEVDVLADGDAWPDAGRRVGEAVAAGRAERGIVCCWTGTGVSMAANHVGPAVRAALCTDAETARGARRWNDANVLALSLRLLSEALAEEVIGAFLSTAPDEAERPQIDRC
jgi:ribose 5-phosphate isomerase B